jgi:hypothetical protein
VAAGYSLALHTPYNYFPHNNQGYYSNQLYNPNTPENMNNWHYPYKCLPDKSVNKVSSNLPINNSIPNNIYKYKV